MGKPLSWMIRPSSAMRASSSSEPDLLAATAAQPFFLQVPFFWGESLVSSLLRVPAAATAQQQLAHATLTRG